jgi:DNA invertase Pin-like site-specific DNA recombinase
MGASGAGRLALYARVSTGQQTADPQLDALRAYADARGGGAAEYVDEGVSGARASRPALDRLARDVARRRIDAVVVTKLDRLARSVRHLTELAATLEAAGVALVVLDQGIDTATPTGRLLFHVLGAIAEFERDLIRERVVAGMEAARRRGRLPGRPRRVTDDVAREARALRAAGLPLRAIARGLGVSLGSAARAARPV